ncbi:hypothetical protein ACFC1T_34160 [Kitasatospora sp. NPDC056076]|uniref:hypothetical protein n=1 Tax=Kitasatospora sp. NPDC056076 TaxID=3345703 RepID=UPI0035DBB616
MTGSYHVCFTVPDLDSAMADLTAAGVRWREPANGRSGDWDYRIVAAWKPDGTPMPAISG